ncbi:MAG: hypothetical protein J4F41_04335 [Alphaproteobacteria bacterium]|nr:hypothetical protein [Alphaproteobacteria bacterium]
MLFSIHIFGIYIVLLGVKILQKLRILPDASGLWADSFCLKHLGSTHPRRTAFYYNHGSYFSALRKISINPQDPEQREIDQGFYDDGLKITQLKNKHLIFIGDSHVEFFSRVKAQPKDHYFRNTSAIWLGPKTLMGYAHQSNLDEDAKRIATLLKPVIASAHRNNKSVKIIWCMGTIDIRFSIYELVLRQVMPTENDILNLFEQAAEKIITSHIPNILNHLDMGSIELGYAACTNILGEGHSPTSIKEIKRLRQAELFPTFGTSDQRDGWMVEANTRLKKICQSHNMAFFDFALTDINSDRHRFSRDGIHLTDPAQLNSAVSSYLQTYESRHG